METYEANMDTGLLTVGKQIETNNTEEGIKAIQDMWATLPAMKEALGVPEDGITAGIYSNYTEDGYTFTMGVMADDVTNQNEECVEMEVIPGNYKVYELEAESLEELTKAVAECWNQIWADQSLKRTFQTDMELYISETKANIYVGIE